MFYVTDYAEIGCRSFDDVATEHATPEAAAVACASWIWNECCDGDDDIQDCLEADEDDVVEYLVCGEDGRAWIVGVSKKPERFDRTRAKGHRMVWAFDVHGVRPSDERFRWHVFTEEDVKQYSYGEPGPSVHHFCKGDPCADCVELDKGAP